LAYHYFKDKEEIFTTGGRGVKQRAALILRYAGNPRYTLGAPAAG
jgi:hypothetical protein